MSLAESRHVDRQNSRVTSAFAKDIKLDEQAEQQEIKQNSRMSMSSQNMLNYIRQTQASVAGSNYNMNARASATLGSSLGGSGRFGKIYLENQSQNTMS